MEIMYFVLGMVAAAALVVGVVIFNVRVKINKLSEEVTQLNEGLKNAFNVCDENRNMCDRKVDEVWIQHQNDLTGLYRDMDSRFNENKNELDNVYRDMDSRFDKFETRFKKELIKG